MWRQLERLYEALGRDSEETDAGDEELGAAEDVASPSGGDEDDAESRGCGRSTADLAPSRT